MEDSTPSLMVGGSCFVCRTMKPLVLFHILMLLIQVSHCREEKEIGQRSISPKSPIVVGTRQKHTSEGRVRRGQRRIKTKSKADQTIPSALRDGSNMSKKKYHHHTHKASKSTSTEDGTNKSKEHHYHHRHHKTMLSKSKKDGSTASTKKHNPHRMHKASKMSLKGHHKKKHCGKSGKSKSSEDYAYYKGKGGVHADPPIGVHSFLLIDADRDVALGVINEGDIVNVQEISETFGTRTFNFECVTYGQATSTFLSSNMGFTNLDNRSPWTLVGDSDGDYFGIRLDEIIGLWRISCQPLMMDIAAHAARVAGPTSEVWFVIADRITEVDLTRSPSTSFPTIYEIPSVRPTTALPSTVSAAKPTTVPSTIEPAASFPTGFPFPDMTLNPTASPTEIPTSSPTTEQTRAPTQSPSNTASSAPTGSPSEQLSPSPSASPSLTPTTSSTLDPTGTPTRAPTDPPTNTLTTAKPSNQPSQQIVYGLQPDCNTFDPNRFNICLDIASESGEVEEWFSFLIQAKERWERIINNVPWGPWGFEDLEGISRREIATQLPANGVDDIYIAVYTRNITTPGLYALAGPTKRDQTNNRHIVAGSIQIDPGSIPEILEQDIFFPLMMHELGHTVGFGLLWGEEEIDGFSYTGANALNAWRAMGCTGDLPLERVNPPFKPTHWDENCLVQELMTPLLQFRRTAFVSALTMGALEDLGYSVNRDEEDAYGLDQLGICGDFCPEATARRQLDESKTNR